MPPLATITSAPSFGDDLRAALSAGRAAMRRNLLPGMALWALGAALLAAYYLWPAARPSFDAVREAKTHYGVLFSALSGALSGGLIPFAVLWLVGRVPRGRVLATLVFMTVFWIYRGVEVDLFYRLQAFWFGDDPGLRTVATKTAVDMLGYTMCWTMPTTLLAYFWFQDCAADGARFRAGLTRRLFTVRLPALILSAWAVWTPTVFIVYSLPAALQNPVFNVVLCFWVLLVAAVND